MDHLNKSENIGPTYHGEAERRKGGRTSDNSQDTTTKGACRKLDHYWTESEGISLTLAFNHNNNLQCIRTGHLQGCTLMTYQNLHPLIKYVAEIFQEIGDYCLCCWQEITCPNV
jgi:hypothetical protein